MKSIKCTKYENIKDIIPILLAIGEKYKQWQYETYVALINETIDLDKNSVVTYGEKGTGRTIILRKIRYLHVKLNRLNETQLTNVLKHTGLYSDKEPTKNNTIYYSDIEREFEKKDDKAKLTIIRNKQVIKEIKVEEDKDQLSFISAINKIV